MDESRGNHPNAPPGSVISASPRSNSKRHSTPDSIGTPSRSGMTPGTRSARRRDASMFSYCGFDSLYRRKIIYLTMKKQWRKGYLV